jgi:hypothetical protein
VARPPRNQSASPSSCRKAIGLAGPLGVVFMAAPILRPDPHHRRLHRGSVERISGDRLRPRFSDHAR